MNPPPPELLSLGTITIMIAITFFMQSGAIFFNSFMVKEYKGVKTAFFATLALSLGFTIMLLRPFLSPIVMGLFSNLLMMTGHVLIYLAICRFLNKKLNKYLAYGLIPLGYVVLIAAGLFPRGLPLIFVTQFVGFPLDIACAWILHQIDNKRFKTGAYLTAFPLLSYGLITIVRIITGIISPHQVLPGPTLSNIFDVLSFYVLSYLWIAGFILMISQRLQSDLNDLAMNDALTRVRNRRAMQGLLDFEMTRVQREVKDFSIALLDIDHFKHVNDTYGHDVGDQVLHWTAQSLQASLRVQDVVARWGGEEFLILLPDTSLNDAMEITERARTAMEKSIVDNTAVPVKVTFSAGVANSFENRTVDQICKIADMALYIAKKNRNRVVSQDEIPAFEGQDR